LKKVHLILRPKLLLQSLLFSLSAITTSPLSATIYRVKPSADPGNLLTGDSWESATHLNRAIELASSGDEIWIAEGTYVPASGTSPGELDMSFLLKGGVSLIGGFSGTETTSTERDSREHLTILSGDLLGNDTTSPTNGIRVDWSNSTSVCRVEQGNSSPAFLEGVTITMGGNNSTTNPGGGIFCNNGKLSVSNCRFIANYSKYREGGGAVSLNNNSDASFINCVFTGNLCRGDGGAIYSLDSSLTLLQCEFTENIGEDDAGGIYFSQGSLDINLCTFTGNQGYDDGGAIIIIDSDTTISNSVIWKNSEQEDPTAHRASLFRKSGDPARVSNSLIEHCGGSSSWNPSFGGEDLGGNLDQDPLFATPIPDGAFTARIDQYFMGDARPGFGSPLIDRAVSDGNEEPVDLYGSPRIFGGGLDIGAAEWGGQIESDISPLHILAGGTQGRLDRNNLNEIFEFQPTHFELLSNSDPTLANVSIEPSTGIISVMLPDPTLLSSVDLVFGITYDGVTGTLPIALNLIPTVLYVDHEQTEAPDGLTWQTAFTNLQDALSALVPNTSQSIWVAEGIYYPDDGTEQTLFPQDSSFHLISGTQVYGGFSGSESALSERVPNLHQTILSGDLNHDGIGNTSDARQVVMAHDGTEPITLDGFDIGEGYVFGGGHDHLGIGIEIRNTNLIMENIRSLPVNGVFGHISYMSEVIIRNCEFNSMDGTVFTISRSLVSVESSQFRGNTGFRVLNVSSSEVAIESSLFSGNQFSSSLIGLDEVFDDSNRPIISKLKIRQSTITGNQLTGSPPGMIGSQVRGIIAIENPNELDIHNSVFWENGWRGNNNGIETMIAQESGATCSISNSVIQNSGAPESWNLPLVVDAGGNSSTNPIFITPTSLSEAPTTDGNFSLASGSPLINSAILSDAPVPTDVYGNPRVFENISDQGAAEWDGEIRSPVLERIIHSGPHAPGAAQISLRHYLGEAPTTFSITSNDSPSQISHSLDSTSGLLDLDLLEANWQGDAVLTFSAINADQSYHGTINIKAILKVLHVDRAVEGGTENGSNWENAFPYLKDALKASTPDSGQEIWMAGGIYRSDEGSDEVPNTRLAPFEFKSGISTYGGFAGNELSIDARSPGLHEMIIASPLGPPDQNLEPRTSLLPLCVLEVDASADTMFDHVTFQGEPATAVHGTHGLLLVTNGSQGVIKNCVFRGSSEAGISSEVASDLIESCRFEDSSNAHIGISGEFSRYTIRQCSFHNSQLLLDKSSTTVENCNFSADPGASFTGLTTVSTISPGIKISDSTFVGLTDGALRASPFNGYTLSPALSIERCQFLGNKSSQQGGALRSNSMRPVDIKNCEFRGNESNTNGGALAFDSNSFTHTIEGCLFSGNKAAENSGALQAGANFSGSYHIKNCTFSNNLALGQGGAIGPNGASMYIHSSIFFNNSASDGDNIHYVSWRRHIRLLNSLIEGSGGSQEWSAEGLFDLGGNIDVDPLFLSLTGMAPTVEGDFRLQPTSPVIENGGELPSLSIDLNGNPRVSGAFLDMGAYEFQFETGPTLGFSSNFPGLIFDEDANQNGISNFHEYALGAHPIENRVTSFAVISAENVFFQMRDDPHLRPSFQYSEDMVTWHPLLEGEHFILGAVSLEGDKKTQNIQLDIQFRNDHPNVFLRHRMLVLPE